MDNNKQYNIVISSGDLKDDYLVAEIYTNAGIYIGSVCYNGTEAMLDFTCEANNEICRGERRITLSNFIASLNDSLEALGLPKLS